MPDSTPDSDQPRPDTTPPEAGDEVLDAEIVPDAPPVAPGPPPPAFTPDYDDRGVPSFDYVRGRIEGRYGTSIGSAELAGETEQGRALAEQEAERAQKAADKLAEIRRSLGQG